MILSLEASACTGMKTLMWQEVSLGSLLQETAKSKDIAYVYIIDEHGTIVHHSDPLKTGVIVDWKPNITQEDQIDTRFKTLPDSTHIYELAKFFSPMYEPCLSGCCTHFLSVLSRLTRRLPTWDKMDRSLYQISNEYSRMRVLAMLIFTKLGSLTVSRVPIVVGLGTHTVSKTVQTCCAVEVAGAILD